MYELITSYNIIINNRVWTFFSLYLYFSSCIFSYGIRNRDEVTFMKRLRKKWNVTTNICHVKKPTNTLVPAVCTGSPVPQTWNDFDKVFMRIQLVLLLVYGAVMLGIIFVNSRIFRHTLLQTELFILKEAKCKYNIWMLSLKL